MTSLAVGFYVLFLLMVVTAMVCGLVYVCAQTAALVARIGRVESSRLPVLSGASAIASGPVPSRCCRTATRTAASTSESWSREPAPPSPHEPRASSGSPPRDPAESAPVRFRSHELVAGFALLLFSSTAIRVLGLCLVANALLRARFPGRCRSVSPPACWCRSRCRPRSYSSQRSRASGG